jgi:fructan beta-fructosidase
MYRETLRPQFHFTAREHWLNDPNGLFFYQGNYHLFFQHNPFGNEWGNMTWGHAVSPDLLHWRQVDNALEPDALGTMYSGCAVVDWHNTSGLQTGDHPPIVLVYTAAGGTSVESQGKAFTQCLAYSTDGGETWAKYPGNPVLAIQRDGNRDPKVIWHAPTQHWIMTLYLSENDFAFYNSPDLIHWTYLHDILAPESIECPDFFEMIVEGTNDLRKWVWVAGNGQYYVGRFDGQRFTPESGLLVGDWGANFYACQSFSDIPATDGRRIQIAWMKDGSYPGMPFNQQMSFPCELRLRQTSQGLRLTRQPIKEVERLRAVKHAWKDLVLQSQALPLETGREGLWELSMTISPGNARSVGLNVLGTQITFSPGTQALTCDGRTAPLEMIDGSIHLRCLVDRTSIEVFGNDGLVSMTSCFLPGDYSSGIMIFSHDGDARFDHITIFEMDSIW